jgi:hypothetical protein
VGRYINKTGENEYIEISTITDTPVTYFCTRDEMRDILREPSLFNQGWWMPNEKYVEELLSRADEHLTTSRLGSPPKSYEEALDEVVETYNMNRQEKLDRWKFRDKFTYNGDEEEKEDRPVTAADAHFALAVLKMEMAQLPKGGIQQHNLRNVERVLERLRDNGFLAT